MHRSFFYTDKKKSCGYFYFHFSLHPIKQVRFASSIESWNWSYRLQIILHTFALSILSIESGVIDSFLLSRIVGWLVICGQLKTQHWYFWKTIPLWEESNFLLFFFSYPRDFCFFPSTFLFDLSIFFLLNFPKIFRFFCCSFLSSFEFWAFVIFQCTSIYPKNQQICADIAFIVSSHAA